MLAKTSSKMITNPEAWILTGRLSSSSQGPTGIDWFGQAWEASRLSAILCLCYSNPISQSNPQLCCRLLAVASPPICSWLLSITQNSSNFSPHSSSYRSSHIQQASSNTAPKLNKEANRPAEQIGKLRSSFSLLCSTVTAPVSFLSLE